MNRGQAAANLLKELTTEDDDPIIANLADFDEIEDEDYCLASSPADEPTWSEAMRSPDREKWLEARDKEIVMLEQMHTFDVVRRPLNVNAIPTHFVNKIKWDANGEIEKHKVRFVAGGHKQISGVDFFETHAAVARNPSHRIILAYGAQRSWDIHQIDIMSAYLNAPILKTSISCYHRDILEKIRKVWLGS
jgi:hypothetical protein